MNSATAKIFLNGVEIFEANNGSTFLEIINNVTKQTGLKHSDFYLTKSNGKKLENTEIFDSNLYVNLRLVGGKGGFGSMLRAIGAQIEKTTNREACRDLSGRRLRDINEEKRLKVWLDKQKDRDSEAAEKKRKKLEKLMAVPKHEFKDTEYENARTELTEKVSESVEEGFKMAAKNSIKRKCEDPASSSRKKKALWIDDLSSDSDSDSDSDSEDEKEPSKSISDRSNDSAAGTSISSVNKLCEISENSCENSVEKKCNDTNDPEINLIVKEDTLGAKL